MIKILISLVMLCIIAGCATQKAYKGNKINTNEISTISPLSPSLFRFGHPPIAIREVDGIKLNILKSGAFETLPGKHTVFILMPSSPSASHHSARLIKMTFNTEAGKKYIIDYKNKNSSKIVYFVLEEDSGKVIYEIEN